MIFAITTLVLLSAFLFILPGLTRPDLFFAVTIHPEFRATRTARAIRGRFRATVIAIAAVAIGFQLATGLFAVAILIQLAGDVYALVAARNQVRSFAVAPSPVVEVALDTPAEKLPGGLFIALLPSASLIALAALVYMHVVTLPSQFPSYWGVSAGARWISATPAAIAAFLLARMAISLVLVSAAWGILHWSRRIAATGASAARERGFRRKIIEFMLAMNYLLVFQAWIGLLDPVAVALSLWSIAAAAVTIIFLLMLVRIGQGGSYIAQRMPAGTPAGDRTPDRCWKLGFLYFNPNDPSLFVERRFGIGYTINFGNLWSVLFLGLIFVAIAARRFLK